MQFLSFLNNVAQDSGLLLSFWRRAMYIFLFLQKTMSWFGILWKWVHTQSFKHNGTVEIEQTSLPQSGIMCF